MKNIKKTTTKFTIVWGGILKLRGEISPPKGPEKNTVVVMANFERSVLYTSKQKLS